MLVLTNTVSSLATGTYSPDLLDSEMHPLCRYICRGYTAVPGSAWGDEKAAF
jgi:hypothetical protein